MDKQFWKRIAADMEICDDTEFLDLIYSAKETERQQLLHEYFLVKNKKLYEQMGNKTIFQWGTLDKKYTDFLKSPDKKDPYQNAAKLGFAFIQENKALSIHLMMIYLALYHDIFLEEYINEDTIKLFLKEDITKEKLKNWLKTYFSFEVLFYEPQEKCADQPVLTSEKCDKQQ